MGGIKNSIAYDNICRVRHANNTHLLFIIIRYYNLCTCYHRACLRMSSLFQLTCCLMRVIFIARRDVLKLCLCRLTQVYKTYLYITLNFSKNNWNKQQTANKNIGIDVNKVKKKKCINKKTISRTSVKLLFYKYNIFAGLQRLFRITTISRKSYKRFGPIVRTISFAKVKSLVHNTVVGQFTSIALITALKC